MVEYTNNEITALREHLSMDQKEFAAILKVSQAYISKIENELMNPNELLLFNLMNEFGFNINGYLESRYRDRVYKTN